MAKVSDKVKAVASLNTGMTHQYNLRDGDRARAAYADAVKLNADLQAEVDRHLSKLDEGLDS